MSGPTTVVVHPDLAIPVLLAAAAIRAARAVQQASEEAAALRDANAQDRVAEGQRQAAAHQHGLAALLAQAEAADQRLARLAELSAQFGGDKALEVARPMRPLANELPALASYVRAVEAFAADAQHQLVTALAGQPALPDDDGFDALLSVVRRVPSGQAPLSARLLARIAHLGAPPSEIQALAQALDAAANPARAELLASELRRRVQLHAQEALEQEVQRAQALVMEQSLLDLGYQVDGIEATLFVEGGVAHFRKSHWGDHMVRMRVAADGGSVNFNVLRAVDATLSGAASGAPSVQDHLAEDRWCAEFPALLKTLAARGLRLEVTRRLEAGELPVQRVARDQLPRFAETEADAARGATPARARELP